MAQEDCVCFFCLLSSLTIAGACYQFVGSKIDERNYPPPGKMVDVGGYRLHINTLGENTHPGPTVVLESGLGCNSLDWALVQPKIAKFARVCSYDRSGSGWSDESSLERTSQNIVEELHTLLHTAGIPEPYVLVGHSFGGINVRLYTSRYPKEVAGVILVDSSHEDQLQKLPSWPDGLLEKYVWNRDMMPFWASVGLTRCLSHFSQFQTNVEFFPPDIQKMYLAESNTTKFFRTVSSEASKFKESLQQLKNDGGFLGKRPLIVLSAGNSPSKNRNRMLSRIFR
jgi:pimeloyl-ACP methyl ester carboxylesterase